jgi:hypothetical protein
MSILRTCLIGLMTGAMMCDPVMFIKPANADAPALFFDTHKTRLPHASCIRDARRTMREVGLAVHTNLDFAVGGSVGNTNVMIFCTFIPRGGPCPGQDGAVVTMISTSPPGPEAGDMLKRLQKSFGNAVLFDCN